MKTLFLSPLQPQNAGGGWGEGGGGGRGGIPASFPSRSPPPKQPFQPTPTPSPGPPGGLRKNRRPLVGRAPSPGGPGPKPPGDLAHRPLRPGSRHSHRLTFLTSCCVLKLWVRVSKRYHKPWGALDGFRRRSCTVP